MPAEAPTSRTVASSDGVAVVVHHVAPGPASAPLLIAHATGFHGRAYGPMAVGLADRHDVWALDFRGHGASAAPVGWVPDWNRYADDADAVARWVTDRAGGDDGRLVGFGHSMGGASLLTVAHRHPGLFRALVLFEPIVFPPFDDDHDPEASPLVIGARRRRSRFDSYTAAIDNFFSKPPMSSFDPLALEAYVRGGLTLVDPDDEDGPVRLCCDPQLEADTFATSRVAGAWAALADIETPTVVIGSRPDAANPPAVIAELIADRLAGGRFSFQPELDHFGPFVEPGRVADLARSMVG